MPLPPLADEQQNGLRPTRPRLDHAKRVGIGLRDQKIFTRKLWIERQFEADLLPAQRIGPRRHSVLFGRVYGLRQDKRLPLWQIHEKMAFAIFLHGEAHDDAGRRGHRHGDDEARETEQTAEGQQGKHQPDRMQPNIIANELGRNNISLEKLPDDDNTYRPLQTASSAASLERSQ